jgi:hypothetical protein
MPKNRRPLVRNFGAETVLPGLRCARLSLKNGEGRLRLYCKSLGLGESFSGSASKVSMRAEFALARAAAA